MADNAYISPDISSLLGLVDTHLRWKQLQEAGSRSYKHYHPSEWGKCLRRQQYKHLADRGFIEIDPVIHGSKTQRLFDKGHNMHHRWQQFYFADMGILRGVWECPKCKERYGRDEKIGVFMPDECSCGFEGMFNYHEVTVVSKEMNIRGHVDIILDFSRFDPNKYEGVRATFNVNTFPKKPIVIDMKTIGSWSWKNTVQKTGVHKEYLIQVTIYTHLLDCQYGIVMYENKDNSELMACKVERSDEVFNEIRRQAEMMQKLANYKKDDIPMPLLPPPRPDDKSCFECSKCEFAPMCHSSGVWEDPKIEEKRRKFYGILL